jgi:hypothetical protein
MDYLEEAKLLAAKVADAPGDADDVQLRIDAGIIPESPAAAYRLGVEHGRIEAPAPEAASCWACGRPRVVPDHGTQVRELAEMHYLNTSPWHWSPAEFEVLREVLDEHGPNAYLDALISRRPGYGTARIITENRMVVDVPRGTLLKRAKERAGEAKS